MTITCEARDPALIRTDVLLIFFPEGLRRVPRSFVRLDRKLSGALTRILIHKDFSGALKETRILYTHGALPTPRVILVGLGKRHEIRAEAFREACGAGVRAAGELKVARRVGLVLSEAFPRVPYEEIGRAVVESALLSLYEFQRYKARAARKGRGAVIRSVSLVTTERTALVHLKKGVKYGTIIAHATNFARDLANEPANIATPTLLAREAKVLARQEGLSVKVLSRPDMKKLKMGALLGVAQGSEEPPKFIVLEHKKRKSPTIVLAGKGITFDSGGISIKPSAKMDEMKFDMAGGAAVLGVMRAVAQLDLPLHVVGLIPSTENLPSGSAQRPGDVVRTMSGKTVEVLNTDAEGRMILADALSYAHRYKPDAIIDVATLTGAVVIALGEVGAGLFSNNSRLARAIVRSSRTTGEKVWRLPLWNEYSEQIRGDVADLKNVGGSEGGPSTAAKFLEEFAGRTPWAHLDIAGTAWTTKPKAYLGKGATGASVRLLVEVLTHWS